MEWPPSLLFPAQLRLPLGCWCPPVLNLRLPHPRARGARQRLGLAVSSKKHQVRLDDDVAQALGRDAERKGTSLNVAANTWLRRSLGLTPTGPAPVAEAQPAKARVVPAGSTVPTACTHPPNRRLGPHCGACGATFKVKAGPRA